MYLIKPVRCLVSLLTIHHLFSLLFYLSNLEGSQTKYCAGQGISNASWTAACDADKLLQGIFEVKVLYCERKVIDISAEKLPNLSIYSTICWNSTKPGAACLPIALKLWKNVREKEQTDEYLTISREFSCMIGFPQFSNGWNFSADIMMKFMNKMTGLVVFPLFLPRLSARTWRRVYK